MSVDGLGYGQLSYSQTNKLLQDVNMRVAISMCIDREALVARGHERRSYRHVHPRQPRVSRLRGFRHPAARL